MRRALRAARRRATEPRRRPGRRRRSIAAPELVEVRVARSRPRAAPFDVVDLAARRKQVARSPRASGTRQRFGRGAGVDDRRCVASNARRACRISWRRPTCRPRRRRRPHDPPHLGDAGRRIGHEGEDELRERGVERRRPATGSVLGRSLADLGAREPRRAAPRRTTATDRPRRPTAPRRSRAPRSARPCPRRRRARVWPGSHAGEVREQRREPRRVAAHEVVVCVVRDVEDRSSRERIEVGRRVHVREQDSSSSSCDVEPAIASREREPAVGEALASSAGSALPAYGTRERAASAGPRRRGRRSASASAARRASGAACRPGMTTATSCVAARRPATSRRSAARISVPSSSTGTGARARPRLADGDPFVARLAEQAPGARRRASRRSSSASAFGEPKRRARAADEQDARQLVIRHGSV